MKDGLSDMDKTRITQILILRTIIREVLYKYDRIYSGIIKILLYMFYHPDYMASHSERIRHIFDIQYQKLMDRSCDYTRLANAIDRVPVSEEDWILFNNDNNYVKQK